MSYSTSDILKSLGNSINTKARKYDIKIARPECFRITVISTPVSKHSNGPNGAVMAVAVFALTLYKLSAC